MANLLNFLGVLKMKKNKVVLSNFQQCVQFFRSFGLSEIVVNFPKCKTWTCPACGIESPFILLPEEKKKRTKKIYIHRAERGE